MDGLEIPGFYFDAEKKKYFAVQTRPELGGSASKYTKTSIIKQARRSATDGKRKQDELNASNQLRRSKILSTQQGHLMRREIGDVEKDRVHGAILLHDERLRSVEFQPPNVDIRAFAWDEATSGPLLAVANGTQTRTASSKLWSDFPARSPSSSRLPVSWDLAGVVDSVCTSVSIHHGSRTVGYSFLGNGRGQSGSFQLAQLVDTTYLPAQAAAESDFSIHFQEGHLGHGQASEVWSSAATPFDGASPAYALGCTCAVKQLTAGCGSWDVVSTLDLAKAQSTVMAIDWLNAATIAAGQRNGTVRLWDVRVNDTAARLYHGASIIGIKALSSGNQVLVHGLEDTLKLYDLRMSVRTVPITTVPQLQKRKRRQATHSYTSDAVLEYAYSNHSTRNVSSSFSPELGLLAAVDENMVLNMYHCQKGSLLKSYKLPHTTGRACAANIDFVRVNGSIVLVGCIQNRFFWIDW